MLQQIYNQYFCDSFIFQASKLIRANYWTPLKTAMTMFFVKKTVSEARKKIMHNQEKNIFDRLDKLD